MPSYAKKLRMLHAKRDAAGIARPVIGNDSSTCFKCGRRILLPRQKGNLCPTCSKVHRQNEYIDKKTKELLKKYPWLIKEPTYWKFMEWLIIIMPCPC